jgi:hypothetical protein
LFQEPCAVFFVVLVVAFSSVVNFPDLYGSERSLSSNERLEGRDELIHFRIQ